MLYKNTDKHSLWYFLAHVSIFLSAWLFVRFVVNAPGYVIDIENDTLKFPGGGIAAASFFSYFNPMYWLQGLWRHKIPLSQIRQVETYRETTSSIDKEGKLRTSKKDILDINGDFGAVQFSFVSKGKRDQLYSAIVQINEMGSPVLRR